MDGEVIPDRRRAFRRPRRHVPCPGAEGVIVGMAGGAAAGLVAGWIAGEMEAPVLMGFALAPFFAAVGGWLGRRAQRRGWAAVRPLAWALLGGVVLSVDSPFGWVLGGTIGGCINGLRDRSPGRVVRGAWLGAALGLAGWAATWAYLLGLFRGLDALCGG
jgi:hypothetical protein